MQISGQEFTFIFKIGYLGDLIACTTKKTKQLCSHQVTIHTVYHTIGENLSDSLCLVCINPIIEIFP